MNIDFLKPVLGEELFAQVAEKLGGTTGVTLANISDGSYVPKQKFDEEHTNAKALAAQVKDLTAQLTEAQKRAGDADALNAQIAQLTKDIADRDGKLASLSTDYDIKDALRAAKARDVDIVFSLLDRSKITAKDGKLSGADEQIKALRESKGFLFDTESEHQASRGGFGGQQDIIGGAGAENANAAVNNAIRAMTGRA